MKIFYFIGVLAFLHSSMLFGQDNPETTTPEKESKALQLSGSLDAYYRYNLGSDYNIAPGTSFANLPGFSLGMANLMISKEGKKVGFMADLVVGPRGEEAVFGSVGSANIINQLYAWWQISDKVKVTFGNFNTFLGYEVISPLSNFNYSTSYLFSYGPFSHTGIKFDVELPNNFSLMGGFFNPTDATEFNPSNDYVGGLQLGYSTEKGSVYLNGLFSEDFYQVDITTGFDVSEKIHLGLNASSASDLFFGTAVYCQVSASDKLMLGTRLEYFYDNGIELFGDKENIIDFTFSANYKIGDLTIIPEFRLDLASQDIFSDGEEFNKSMSSLLVAVVYGF